MLLAHKESANTEIRKKWEREIDGDWGYKSEWMSRIEIERKQKKEQDKSKWPQVIGYTVREGSIFGLANI